MNNGISLGGIAGKRRRARGRCKLFYLILFLLLLVHLLLVVTILIKRPVQKLLIEFN